MLSISLDLMKLLSNLMVPGLEEIKLHQEGIKPDQQRLNVYGGCVNGIINVLDVGCRG